MLLFYISRGGHRAGVLLSRSTNLHNINYIYKLYKTLLEATLSTLYKDYYSDQNDLFRSAPGTPTPPHTTLFI